MNRKQRRAQATSSASGHSSGTIHSADDIPLALPDRSPTTSSGSSKAKTLYEIAVERQAGAGLSASDFDPGNVVNVTVGPDGEIVPLPSTSDMPAGDPDDPSAALLARLNSGRPSGLPASSKREAQRTTAADGPEDASDPGGVAWFDTLLLASSLSALHFTLETLTVHQYAEDLLFGPIWKHTLCVAFPVLAGLIHLMHGHVISPRDVVLRLVVGGRAGDGRATDGPVARQQRRTEERVTRGLYYLHQVVFLTVATVAGCHLIQLTNDKGYMAVMKNAPGIGTLWVWSVIEMGLVGAVLGVIGPGGYAWWYGYGIW